MLYGGNTKSLLLCLARYPVKVNAAQTYRTGVELQTEKNPNLLIVDDSAIIRKMIMTALRPLNPVFREASSGLEALEQVMLRQYDCITLDLNMPDMHGLEFLRFVRSHQHFNDIPILVITTQKENSIRDQVLSAGADAFLIKPFQPQDILTEVKSLLGGDD